MESFGFEAGFKSRILLGSVCWTVKLVSFSESFVAIVSSGLFTCAPILSVELFVFPDEATGSTDDSSVAAWVNADMKFLFKWTDS